jgi:hypothetical protein
MLSKSILPGIVLFFSSFLLNAQNTVGVILNTDQNLDGYTFFSPFSGTKAYLVDNCGRLINQWDRGTRPGLSAYFLENGLMLRTYKVSPKGPFTSASNAGGIELVDWDNNTVWRYEINTSDWLSHHDVVMMPNGHLLVLTWQLIYRDELIALGRNPSEIAPQNYMWSEKIIEIQPIGTNEANIVWEWNIYDHYIQDFDASKEGYGIVEDHPELFNINLPDLNSSNSNATRDWNHFNAIDYHPGLDQILISVRNSDEIWILDHSTTTEEAAGHTGGRYNKGGDILYRWGNGSAYDRAPASEQKLFGQHGVNWIKEGLQDAGKILIYNNGNGRPGPDFSTAEILNPPVSEPGYYILPADEAFGPLSPEWVFGDQLGEDFYSPYLSNAQRLSNGNTLVNAGSPGVIFEVHPFRSKVWEYVIPLYGDQPASQGQNVSNNGNFRAYKFAKDFAGFQGKDLTPGQAIEFNPTPCEQTVSTDNESFIPFEIYYDSTNKNIHIATEFQENIRLSLLDLSGKIYSKKEINNHNLSWKLPHLPTGIYIVFSEFKGQNIFSTKLFIY